MSTIIPIISVLSVFVFAPAIVFGFIFLSRKSKLRIEEIRYKRDLMALEIEKDRVHLQMIEAENKKYDRIIEDASRR